jgi:hypothetical protein
MVGYFGAGGASGSYLVGIEEALAQEAPVDQTGEPVGPVETEVLGGLVDEGGDPFVGPVADRASHSGQGRRPYTRPGGWLAGDPWLRSVGQHDPGDRPASAEPLVVPGGAVAVLVVVEVVDVVDAAGGAVVGPVPRLASAESVQGEGGAGGGEGGDGAEADHGAGYSW